MTRRFWVAPISALIAVSASACNSDTSGPGSSGGTDVIVLNAGSRTIQQFTTDGESFVAGGGSFTLPSNYDGTTLDLSLDVFVTTSSAGAGSIIWGSLETGETAINQFPGTGAADPGRPTLVVLLGGQLGAFVPARGHNALYIGNPEEPTASLFASDVGEYVQRAIPFGDLVISIDANLDDVGGTLDPLGATRLEYSELLTGTFFDEVEIIGGVGAVDVSLLGDDLVVLAGGTLDDTILPEGNGSLAHVNALGRGVVELFPLDGNGLAIEGGRDGLAYVTRTKGAGTFETDVLSFSFSTGNWVRGPANPIQPADSDGSDLNSCRVTTALVNGLLVCATFDQAAPAAPGRLVLLQADGTFIAETGIGAGATDIALR